MLTVDEEEEKAREEERRELGTRSDPCLLINLSERDRKRAREREIEGETGRRREREMDPSAEVFTRWFEVQIHFSSSSSSPSFCLMWHSTGSPCIHLPVVLNSVCMNVSVCVF